MKKRTGLAVALLALPCLVFAQEKPAQTMNLQGTIQVQPDLPNLTVMGKRQQAEFPITTLDLHAKELLTRVPKALIAADPIERTPITSIDTKRDKVAK